MGVPPVGVVYQSIALPADVAFKLDVPPLNITEGVAVTGSGDVAAIKTTTALET